MARPRGGGNRTPGHASPRVGTEWRSARGGDAVYLALRPPDVILTFEESTNDYFARQIVFERIAQANLPTGVTPSLAPLFSPSGLVYRYVLESPDRSPQELKTIEYWVVERAYRSVHG